MTLKIRLKRPKEKTSVLMVEFSKNGTPFKFYTGKSIQCKNWSESKQEVLSKEENFEYTNSYLDKWKTELKRIIAEMEANRERLNQDTIRTRLDAYFKKANFQEETENGITDFISFIDDYLQTVPEGQKNKLIQTRKHVLIAFNLLTKKHLVEMKNFRKRHNLGMNLKADYKLPFEDVNLKLIEKFKTYFYQTVFTIEGKRAKNKYHITKNGIAETKSYKDNYIHQNVKILKQFITAAIEANYVEQFTWNTVKTTNNEVDSIYTDFEEIQALYNADLQDILEKQVRDKYTFNCFFGMRYGDLNKVDAHCFSKKVISGKEYLIYSGRMGKTDQRIEFALHDVAREILERYNYQLPKINLSVFNPVLKAVTFKAGLTAVERIREIRAGKAIVRDVPKFELMSSHAGRRSFCTNFYNEAVAIAAIMSISGHKTENEFRKYIKKASVRLEIVAEQISAIKGINFK